MDQKRAAAALFALAACFACSTAAPTSGNQTALDLFEAPVEGCYYNFQHYGEGDRIMTNEPCLNCTCHNRMLMCYLRVCPFTKPIGQDCTVEKRADQCCPIVTCPDVPVDLLTSTSTSSPAEYGATGLGRLDKYGCSINGKYFPEGAKVPPTPNKPCEHCYCIHNMTTCVMQECTLHVDGCTPIYHKDVCCPIRYSCDHPEDEIPLLDDMTTTVRPTPGFLLTTTTMMPVTQATQDCIHDDKMFADGALIKTEKACEHCYCMKGDIVCVVQECGTPMENEGKNCTSLQPKHGQCCPDTYICEGDDIPTTGFYEETTTLSPPRRVGVEGSGYRNEPDELYTEIPSLDTESEGSGEEQLLTTIPSFNAIKDMPETTNEDFYQYSTEPEKEITVLNLTTEKGDQGDDILATTSPSTLPVGFTMLDSTQEKIDQGKDDNVMTTAATEMPEVTTVIEDNVTQKQDDYKSEQELTTKTLHLESTEPSTTSGSVKVTIPEVTTKPNIDISDVDNMTPVDEEFIIATKLPDNTDSINYTLEEGKTTIKSTNIDESVPERETTTKSAISTEYITNIPITTSYQETTTLNVQENEILEEMSPARIPGEGDCLFNGITFKNNTSVPSTGKCHSQCRCVSSIIKCDPIICTPPLEYMENMNDCQPIYDSPESCCPTYVCSTKETVAPESHSQMSGTESPKPIIECLGDECHINQDNGMQEKPTEHDCGENGCLTNEHSTLPQKDLNECVNGNCDIITVQHPVTDNQLCDRVEGCQVPVIKPCEGDNCKTEQDSHEHKDIQDKFESNFEPCDDINGCQVPVITPCKDNNCKSELESPIHEEKDVQDKPEICDTKNGCDKQIDKDRDDICNEENCRRKEYGEVDTHVQCSGTDCMQQETILPTVSDINTPKQEQVTEIHMETTSKPDLDNISQDNTMSDNQSTIKPIKKIDTTEVPIIEESHTETTSPDIQQSFEGFVTHQEEIVTETPNVDVERVTTVSSHTDITDEEIQSTESSISRTDKTTTPTLDAITTKQHLTAATENLPKTSMGYTSEGTEKYTIEYTTSSESLTLDEINKDKITVTDIQETTASSVMFTDKLKLEITTQTEDNNIADEHKFAHVTKPHLEEKTTENVMSEESASTNVPEMFTSIPQDGISTEHPEVDILTTKEILNMDLTVEPISETTKFAEITTEHSVTEQKESGPSTLSESTQSQEISTENISETESPEPLGTNSISTEISKLDEEDVHSQVVDLTTAIQDNNEYEKATTPLALNEETTVYPLLSEKVTDGQLKNETATSLPHLDLENYQTPKPISTEDLESFTELDLLQTTQSIEMDIDREHSGKPEIIPTTMGETTDNIIDDKVSIKDVPELYTEVPSYLTTDSKVYSTSKDTTTMQSDFENITKIPTSDSDHKLEEQTEISNTIKPSISEEEINTSTESPKYIDTTLQELLVDKTTTLESNNESLEDGHRGTTEYQEQTTRKSTNSIFITDSETKTSDEVIHQDEINIKTTTPAYNKYDEVSKETTVFNLPSISDTTEFVSELTTQENILIAISKVSTTESSDKPIETDMIVNTESLPKTDVPSKLNEEKPFSTVFDQEDYSTTTVMNYENTQALYDETKTEKTSDTYDDEKKITESFDSQFTKSDDYISSEKTDIITDESNTTPEPHVDVVHEHEFSSSTQSSVVSDITEQEIKTTTNIIELKQKETEQPMSLVTEKQSIPVTHETATENIQTVKVTETNESEVTDRSTETGPYLHDEIESKTTTSTESFTTKQVDLINENMAPTSEISTEMKYPKVTSELPKETIIYEDEQTTVQKMSSETPLSVDSEQPAVTEKTSEELTTQYETDMLVTTSTTEPQNETKIKPDIPHMTSDERSEMSTELPEVQTEKDIYATEKPISRLGDQSTEAQKDLSQSSSAPIVPEAQDVTDQSLLIDEITKQPESLTTIIENEEFTKNIVTVTEEPQSLTTEIHEQMSTSSEKQTSNVENVYVDVLNPSTNTPNIILSTITSEKEIEYATEIVTRAPEKPSDSNDYVGSNNEQTSTAEDVTKIMIPDAVSTEIPQESQTDLPTAVNDANSVVPAKPDSLVTQPQYTTVPSEVQTQAPEKITTNIYNENITLQDNINKDVFTSTHKDAIMTSTEQSNIKIMEHETTTETKYEYSETTPYFVELEEHTHQIMQESSVIPIGEISTVETTDIQPTERGDQPLTDKLSEDSKTEKATEVTEKPYDSYPVTTQISEEHTSEEIYQTTELANEVSETSGSTGTSTFEPQKGTGIPSFTKPEPSYEGIVTTTTLPHIMQNEESVTIIPNETEKPSILESEIMASTQKFDNITEDKTQKPETMFTETKTPDETSKSTTTRAVYEEATITSTRTPIVDEKLLETLSTTIKPTSKPDFQPTEEVPEFPPSGVSGYGQEPDYGEEDQAFGPGTCRYGGKVYVSAQQIPRDDPCDFCFCFRSDIICLQQSCPPPIHGCHEEPIQGFCCPRYECPVSMATTLNVTTTTTTTTTTLPPHFLPHAYKGAAQKRGCHIKGQTYKVGEVVRASSGPCLHCTCGGDGQMKCDPKACTPEPMLRQMIAAAVSARRRR